MSRRWLIVLVVVVLIVVLLIVVQCARNDKVEGLDEGTGTPVSGQFPMALPADFNGTWIGKTYVCEGQTIEERVAIVQQGDRLTATKIDGDECVLAGTLTFEGTIVSDTSAELTCITGMPGNPGSSSFTSGIEATDEGFDACNVTYVRAE